MAGGDGQRRGKGKDGEMENSPHKPRLGYQKLEAWKQAVSLAREIRRETAGFKGAALDIRDQMNSSVESVSSNIAEAEGRFSNKDALRIYYIARGSLWELGSQISVCRELGLVDEKTAARLGEAAESVGRLIGGIIRLRRANEEKVNRARKGNRRD